MLKEERVLGVRVRKERKGMGLRVRENEGGGFERGWVQKPGSCGIYSKSIKQRGKQKGQAAFEPINRHNPKTKKERKTRKEIRHTNRPSIKWYNPFLDLQPRKARILAPLFWLSIQSPYPQQLSPSIHDPLLSSEKLLKT